MEQSTKLRWHQYSLLCALFVQQLQSLCDEGNFLSTHWHSSNKGVISFDFPYAPVFWGQDEHVYHWHLFSCAGSFELSIQIKMWFTCDKHRRFEWTGNSEYPSTKWWRDVAHPVSLHCFLFCRIVYARAEGWLGGDVMASQVLQRGASCSPNQVMGGPTVFPHCFLFGT